MKCYNSFFLISSLYNFIHESYGFSLRRGYFSKSSVCSERFTADIDPDDASIAKGGVFTSFDLYTSHPETQHLIIGQIANWARGYILFNPNFAYSVVYSSLDGRRIIHGVGWKHKNTKEMNDDFKNFKYDADGPHGTPVALKERYDISFTTLLFLLEFVVVLICTKWIYLYLDIRASISIH